MLEVLVIYRQSLTFAIFSWCCHLFVPLCPCQTLLRSHTLKSWGQFVVLISVSVLVAFWCFLNSPSIVASNIPHTLMPHPCSSYVLPKYASAISSRCLSSLTSLHSDTVVIVFSSCLFPIFSFSWFLLLHLALCSWQVVAKPWGSKYTTCYKPMWYLWCRRCMFTWSLEPDLFSDFKICVLIIAMSFKHLLITINTEFCYLWWDFNARSCNNF